MNVELLRTRAGRNEVAVLVYEARRPRDVTLVVGHGYSSSKQNLDSLCAFLASHGFAVYSLDFPGHKLGASGGRLDTVDDLLDAFGAVVRLARERGATTLYALGHSMGAVTALCAAARDPSIAGAISIATGYGRPHALAALAGRGVVDLRSSYVDGLSLPELATAWAPVLDAALPDLFGRPTLFIAAEADAMVTLASVRELYDSAAEPKSFAAIAGNHTYAGENARRAVLDWLNERHARPMVPAAGTVSTGVNTVSTGVRTVSTGVNTVSTGVSTVSTNGSTVSTGVSTVLTGVSTVLTDGTTVSTGGTTISTGASTVSTGASAFSNNGSGLFSGGPPR